MNELGPVYGVWLIKTLPLGSGVMRQAMPSRADLEQVSRRNERVAAGYEMLLSCYRHSMAGIRDAVLNERDQLEGMGLTGDQINAVLAIIDEYTPDGLFPEGDE